MIYSCSSFLRIHCMGHSMSSLPSCHLTATIHL